MSKRYQFMTNGDYQEVAYQGEHLIIIKKVALSKIPHLERMALMDEISRVIDIREKMNGSKTN